MTIIASHRGGTHLWPENSLLAFRKTAALPVGYVEFDVQQTRDGVLVVHHDARVDRTTDGTGAVADFSFAELRKLVIIGSGGERIPTFDELLGIFAPSPVNLRLEIKTKLDMQPYAGMEAAIVDRLAATGMLARTLVTSFRIDRLAAFRAAVADGPSPIGAMWLVSQQVLELCGLDGVMAVADQQGVTELGLRHDALGETVIERLRAAGLKVHAWAAHTRAAAERMFDLGVESFTTDRPDLAIAVATERGLI